MKNILVLLTGTETDGPTLRTAFLAARLFGSRLDCLHIRPGPLQISYSAAIGQFESTVNNVALIRSIEKEAKERREAARGAFADFRVAYGSEVRDVPNGSRAICANFREQEGDAVDIAIAEGRFSDLVVLSRGTKAGGFSKREIGSILLACGRPIMLAPRDAPDALGATAIIAWKETAEAARAITAAMPFLGKADRIFVLSGDEGESHVAHGIDSAGRIANQLRAHGLSAEANCVVLGGRPAHDAIVKTAHELGGDVLVMGGYGHSRTRELIFGGFTRHVLEACTLPVLLFH
jgi:nucleotide-binding universal stress UspA family protein